jgi:hypothetical protein
MNHNEMLHWLILGFGLSGSEEDLGRPTNISQLWQAAKKQCFDCDRNEVLDALYTLPGEDAALIKSVSAGEGFHPVSFERVRKTVDRTDYFLDGDFSVKVLPGGRVHHQKLSEQWERPRPAVSRCVGRCRPLCLCRLRYADRRGSAL